MLPRSRFGLLLGWRQVSLLPPELSGLLEAADPAAREAAWKTFVETHSRLLLHTACALSRDYDAAMDAYAYILEQLRRDEFHRLRAYTTQSRCTFTTWLVAVARRLCLDRIRQRYGRSHGAGPESHEARGNVAIVNAHNLELRTVVNLEPPAPFNEMTCGPVGPPTGAGGCAVHGVTPRPRE